MYSIAVLFTSENRVQRQLIKGLMAAGDVLPPQPVRFELFSAGSCKPTDIQRQIKKVSEYRPDVLVTLGNSCTIEAYKKFSKVSKFPIIFLSTSDPVDLGIIDSLQKPGGNFSGSIGEPPSDELPLQMLLAVKPNIPRFILPYYTYIHGGRLAYEVEKMSSFLRSHKKECVPIAISDREQLDDCVRPYIQKGDAVVVPKAGVVALDLPVLGKICDDAGATLFAENDNVIPSHAICGYASDLEFMGRKAVDQIKKLLVDKIPVSELPVYKFKNDNVTQLVFNNNMLIKHGVTLPTNSDYMFTLDDGKDFRFSIRLEYNFVSSFNSTTERALFRHLMKASRRKVDDGFWCEPINNCNQFYNGDLDPFLPEKVLRSDAPLTVVMGHQAACRLQREMLAQKKFTHLLQIRYEDELADEEEPALLRPQEWPADQRIMRMTIPAFDGAKMIKLLRLLFPNIEKIGCIYSRKPGSLEPRLQRLLKQAQAHCDRFGITFVHGGGHDEKSFNRAVDNMIQEAGALFVFPGTLLPKHAEYLSRECYQNSRFVIGADPDREGYYSALLRLNIDYLIDAAFEAIFAGARGTLLPPAFEVELDFWQVYAYSLNERLFAERAIPIPEDLEALLQVAVLRNPFADDDFGDLDDLDGGLMTMKEILAKRKTKRYRIIEDEHEKPIGYEEVLRIRNLTVIWHRLFAKEV